MDKSLFRVGTYSAVLLSLSDAPIVQSLFERCADFSELVEGQPPSPSAGMHLFTDGPPGRSLDDKFVIGLLDESGVLIGALEGMRDYPETGVWWIGLLLLDPAQRGQGIGALAVQAFETWAKAQGAASLGLGVVEANESAFRFWERIGFNEQSRTAPRVFGNKKQAVIIMRRVIIRPNASPG